MKAWRACPLRPVCVGMESVWLLLDGGRDALRRPGLGFLGTCAFRCENPRFWGLEKLGFPWILSSESRLINGLHAIFRTDFFLTLLSSRKSRRNGGPTIRHAEGMDCSWGQLTLSSDFLQEIAARALQTTSIQKQIALGQTSTRRGPGLTLAVLCRAISGCACVSLAHIGAPTGAPVIPRS
jgi:hypothetical protein